MRALAFIVSFAVALSAPAAPEFSGYIQAKEGKLFILTDRDAGAISDYLKLGALFQDYRLAAFDAKSEVLTLDRAGTQVRLALKTSRIRDAKFEPGKPNEVHVAVGAEGNFTIDGQPITLEAFVERLRQLGATGGPIELSIHYVAVTSLNKNPILEAVQKLHVALKEAGVKKWSVRLVHPERSEK